MEAIHTIDDLLWAKENNPSLVKECLKEVTVMEDLETYLKWLSDNEVTTNVTVNLRRNRGRDLGIHPSSACKKDVCLLKLYYECTGELEPYRAYDQKMQQIWDQGTLLHDLFQVHFNELYEDQFKDEVPLVDQQLHIKSHADGIFTFTRVRIVLEMKSIKEGGNFGWAKVHDKPFEDNVRQAHFYMYLENVPFAIIFYINKNNGEIKEHPVVFDEEIWAQMRDEVVLPVVDAVYNDGEMVKGTPGWHCRRCDFYRSCETARRHKGRVKGATASSWGRRLRR